jgi:hypothetical protein
VKRFRSPSASGPDCPKTRKEPRARGDHAKGGISFRRLRILVTLVVPALVAAGGTPNADQMATTGTTPDQLDAAYDYHNRYELLDTSTTILPPDGNALVVSESFVLGWWAGGAWQQDPDYGPLEVGQSSSFSLG